MGGRNSDPNVILAWLRNNTVYRDGKLIRTTNLSSKARIGDAVGTLTHNGYIQTYINGEFYYVHHLVWLYHKGSWPFPEIDHDNTNRADNHIENLKEVPHRINALNHRRSPSNPETDELYIYTDGWGHYLVKFTRYDRQVFRASTVTMNEARLIRDFWLQYIAPTYEEE